MNQWGRGGLRESIGDPNFASILEECCSSRPQFELTTGVFGKGIQKGGTNPRKKETKKKEQSVRPSHQFMKPPQHSIEKVKEACCWWVSFFVSFCFACKSKSGNQRRSGLTLDGCVFTTQQLRLLGSDSTPVTMQPVLLVMPVWNTEYQSAVTKQTKYLAPILSYATYPLPAKFSYHISRRLYRCEDAT